MSSDDKEECARLADRFESNHHMQESGALICEPLTRGEARTVINVLRSAEPARAIADMLREAICPHCDFAMLPKGDVESTGCEWCDARRAALSPVAPPTPEEIAAMPRVEPRPEDYERADRVLAARSNGEPRTPEGRGLREFIKSRSSEPLSTEHEETAAFNKWWNESGDMFNSPPYIAAKVAWFARAKAAPSAIAPVTNVLPSRFQLGAKVRARGITGMISGICFREGKVYYEVGGVMHQSEDVLEPLSVVADEKIVGVNQEPPIEL